MTDNEIIKMLENEADFDCGICCDNGENCLGEECASLISRAALDLINRQNAEIARLQTDVAPVRHGHWIECNYGLTFECSECKYPTEYNLTDYCPNCGAKMEGEENG